MDPRLQMLMFAVLDGEATPEESRELTRLLAENEAVREEYDSLRRLFERLRSVPPLDAPQDLAGAALDRRQRTAPPERRSRSSGSSNPRRGNMSPNRSKQLIWIGGGIAAAAVLAVAFLTIDYPPDSRKTAGTVAPAQRYRAEQPQAGDVKLGDQAVAQLMQTEAFDRFVKDPSTRALAADPSFQALAKYNAEGLRAASTNPEAFAILVKAKSLQNAQQTANQLAAAKSLQNAQQTANQLAAAKSQMNAQTLADAQQQIDAAYKAYGIQAAAVQTLATSPDFAKVAALYPAALTAAVQIKGFGSIMADSHFVDALTRASVADATQTNAQQK